MNRKFQRLPVLLRIFGADKPQVSDVKSLRLKALDNVRIERRIIRNQDQMAWRRLFDRSMRPTPPRAYTRTSPTLEVV